MTMITYTNPGIIFFLILELISVVMWFFQGIVFDEQGQN